MNIFKALASLCLTVGCFSQALAQTVEVEPNNACTEAQVVGPIDVTIPFDLSGSLDTPPDEPDVDFFRFEATPGAEVIVDLKGAVTESGTLDDPWLGLFDSNCNLLAANDDAVSLNSRLRFAVPADGVFVLAATGCCDDDFSGDGFSSGTYALTIGPIPPPIGSIAGRVVDAESGDPLPGDAPPFAFVDLLRCDGDICLEFVSSQGTDSDGRFRFEQDFDGNPLFAGRYQVEVFAEDFEQASTGPFDVGEGENFDTGDIPLERPPFFISDIRPCAELPTQGGECKYSARVNNETDEELEGLAWSLIDGFSLGSSPDFTFFEASTKRGVRKVSRERVSVDPLDDQRIRFQFEVPASVPDGATFCPQVFVGRDPDPLVTPVLQRFLFCVTKGAFEVMAEAQSQKTFRSLSGRSEMRKLLSPKTD